MSQPSLATSSPALDPRGPTVVLGATGKTGRRVAARLDARGVPARRASRGSTPRFDWEDESTWEPVLEGASGAYVAYVPDLAIPGAPDRVTRLAALASRLGLQRLVLLSGRGETEAQRAEAMVAQVFPARTVVRCAFFAQNFDESFLRQPLLEGTLALPVSDVSEPFVDLEDVAEVAVAALTSDAHAGQVYELTGPGALTFAQAVEVIGAAAGRGIAYVPLTMGQFSHGLRDAGMSDAEVEPLEYLFTEVLDGRNSKPADGVRRALGRDATNFRDYAARSASAWRTESQA